VSSLAAIILAAGLSTRMGRAKPLLVWRGKTLLAHAAGAALDAGFDPVIAVIPDSIEYADELKRFAPLVRAIVNPDASRGIGTSIRRGVREISRIDPPVDSLAILLADQPRITATILKALISRHAAAGRLVTAADMGSAIGPPVMINRTLFGDVTAIPDDRGCAAIWREHPEWVERFMCLQAAADIDTPGDFDRLIGDPDSV
jgi:CTP:molybdopterin cytidylyltransferase MocA